MKAPVQPLAPKCRTCRTCPFGHTKFGGAVQANTKTPTSAAQHTNPASQVPRPRSSEGWGGGLDRTPWNWRGQGKAIERTEKYPLSFVSLHCQLKLPIRKAERACLKSRGQLSSCTSSLTPSLLWQKGAKRQPSSRGSDFERSDG